MARSSGVTPPAGGARRVVWTGQHSARDPYANRTSPVLRGKWGSKHHRHAAGSSARRSPLKSVVRICVPDARADGSTARIRPARRATCYGSDGSCPWRTSTRSAVGASREWIAARSTRRAACQWQHVRKASRTEAGVSRAADFSAVALTFALAAASTHDRPAVREIVRNRAQMNTETVVLVIVKSTPFR